MTVLKIRVSSKVTDSKVELRVFKISKLEFRAFGDGGIYQELFRKNDLSEPLTFLEHFLKVWIGK